MSSAPDEVRAWAQARSEARLARDWPEADRLRAAIEAAGWRVIDRGSHFSLGPAHAPDVVEGDRVRYGSSAAVPSRLEEAASAFVTVVIVAIDQPSELARSLDGLRRQAPAGSQVVVVVDRPSPELEAYLLPEEGFPSDPIGGLVPEVIWTSDRLGRAGATNAGMRRAAAPVIVLLDLGVELTGDVLSPLVAALADPGVAVAGPWGLRSDDLRRFEPAPSGDVDAIDGAILAFRRDDLIERGPLDERFRLDVNLDIWWSLVLRDGHGDPARRGLAVADAPAFRLDRRTFDTLDPAERERLTRRSFYRVLDRFGSRRDLLVASRPPQA